MKTNPVKQGLLTENSAGIGTVTRKMVRVRAVELALIAGRRPEEVSKSDWEQAKRELTGEPEMAPKEALLESAPESDRWNPVPGSAGQKVRVSSSADEDDEGRSDNERLVEAGIEDAEHDQMRRATLKPDGDRTLAVVAAKSPARDQILTLIEQQPFFKGLGGPHLELLGESAMETEFEAGQWLFRQGDPANRFYLILEGKVLIETEVKGRGMIPIRTLGPGDDLAWAWLFPPYYMHFSACATEPTRAIFFYGTRLREQCEANHELGYQLMKRIARVVVQNLHATQQRLLECSEGMPKAGGAQRNYGERGD